MTTTESPWATTGWKSMAGTEGTGEYHVIARGSQGRIGVRLLDGGMVRVRVEPANPAAAITMAAHYPASTWKQYGNGGQPRFSCLIRRQDTRRVVRTALKGLGRRHSLRFNWSEWRLMMFG